MAGARDILFDSVKSLERQTAGFLILSEYACSSDSKEHILHEVLGKVMELVGADSGAIALADETSGFFDFAALRWMSLPPPQAADKEKVLRRFRVPLTEGMVGQVYQSHEPVILPEASKHQTFRKDMSDAANYQVRSVLAVPIQTETRRIGVLELFNKTPRGTFSTQDMELAVGLARQIAVVLEVLKLRDSAVPGVPLPSLPPTTGAAPEELMEARRAARDAQAQLRELRSMLDAALRTKDQNALRVKTLAEELEVAKSRAEAATPPQQMVRLLHSVEPFAFTLSLDVVMKNLVELAARLVKAQALQLFLWDDVKESFSLGFSTSSSFPEKGIPSSFKKGEGLAGSAADRMELLRIEDVTREDRFSKSIDEVPGVMSRSILAVPLVANGRLVGVIEAINRTDGQPFSQEDGMALTGMGLLGATALEKVLIHQKLQSAARGVLVALADLVDTRRVSSPGRAERFRKMVLAAGEDMNFSPPELRDAEWAALLMNVGKAVLPPDLLLKEGNLSVKDRDLLASVPKISSDVLASVPSLAGTARIVRHVRECWDGQGTPDKLKGEDIPLGSRVIAVLDAYEGLIFGARGQRAMPPEAALKEIEAGAGQQFDPACVALLVRLVRAGKFQA